MPANQILPFASGTGANALTYAQYSALANLIAQGFQNGIADPTVFNALMRQLSVPTSALAQFTADNQPLDVLDDGVPANFEAKFKAALSNVALALIAANAPQVVTANVTAYVDWQSGSDTNGTGTAAAPFQTIAKAINYFNLRYFFGGFGLTVQLARQSTPGTPSTYYAPPGAINTIPAVTIQGDPANQANYIIGGTVATGSGVVLVGQGNVYLIGVSVAVQGLYNGIGTVGGALFPSNVTLSTTNSSANNYNAFLCAAGTVAIGNGCILVGGYWSSVLSASSSGSNLSIKNGTTLTLSSNTVIGSGFATAFDCGTITTIGASISGPGVSASTGPRYSATLNGVINTGGQGANYFPGNSAGTTATGGQYA